MPKVIHDKLKKEGTKKGLKRGRLDAYVYGTLNKIENGQGGRTPAKKKKRR